LIFKAYVLSKQTRTLSLGPSGVGKTHLATAIGITAAKKRTSTFFIKCHDLIQNLKRARIENRKIALKAV
jgi:DNA replication protein DnaC